MRKLREGFGSMKFTVNVECSPEEARRFMGLPDVTPINEALVARDDHAHAEEPRR
jgi:hypothetical protein